MLTTYAENFQKALCKFSKKCPVLIVDEESEIVKKYRYKVTLNMIFEIFEKKPPTLVLFDKKGEIIELLPELLEKCRSLYISTEREKEYHLANDKYARLYGNSAVICSRFCSLNQVDAVICSDQTSFEGSAVFGEHHLFASGNIDLLSGFEGMLKGKNADFRIGAGLCYIAGEKEFLAAKCSHFSLKNKVYTLEQIKSKITA